MTFSLKWPLPPEIARVPYDASGTIGDSEERVSFLFLFFFFKKLLCLIFEEAST